MILSAKAKDNSLLILDKIGIKKPKTKEIAEILEKLKLQSSSVLVALPAKNDNLIRASRNIPGLQLILAKNLNCLDLLSFKYLVMPKETIKIIKEAFISK
jgi:large subunit ribosomal protein L4